MDATALNNLPPLVIGAAWILVLVAETISPLRARTSGDRVRHIGRNLGVVVGGVLLNTAGG